MIVTLEIDNEKWEVLKPLLEQYVTKTKGPLALKKSFDNEEFWKMRNATRIMHIFNDGCWGDTYTFTGMERSIYCGKPHEREKYCVRTIADLLSVTKFEYMRHRNSGVYSWNELSEFIEKMRKEVNANENGED